MKTTTLLLTLCGPAAAFTPSPFAAPRVLPRSRAVVFSSMPVVERTANSSVRIAIEATGEETLKGFESAVDEFASQVEIRGFRKGAKLPREVVVGQVGQEAIVSKAVHDLSDKALQKLMGQEETLRLVGEPKFENGEEPYLKMFSPGDPLTMHVVCDVWPELSWTGSYENTIKVTVDTEPLDTDNVDKAMAAMQLRYTVAKEMPEDYEAQYGDMIVGDMVGFMTNDDGSKGDPLPQVASGDQLDIVLEKGRFMEGLVEGIVGGKKGDVREVRVRFPEQETKSLGAQLTGKEALFEITISAVKTRQLPELNDEFANSVREGLTYDELYEEVRKTVASEGDRKNIDARNMALEAELVKLVDCEIPETLVIEQAKEKFAIMLSEFREQGTPDEELKKMVTKEGFESYKEIARPNIVKTMKSALAVSDIGIQEGIDYDPEELEDQIQLMKAQAEQKGEGEIDEEKARANLSAQLQREKVLEWLSSKAEVTYNEITPEMIENAPVEA